MLQSISSAPFSLSGCKLISSERLYNSGVVIISLFLLVFLVRSLTSFVKAVRS